MTPAHATSTKFSIMLDPAGDAKNTGRKLDDSFERGVTLQCAEKLKELLEKQHPHIRVVLTRFPGESLQPLQNANFANRLGTDLYVNINFYHETATKPNLFLYTFSYDETPVSQSLGAGWFVAQMPPTSFCAYDKAHLTSSATTKNWAQTMSKALDTDTYKRQFTLHGPFHLPFKPLIGIKAPAVAFEIGLKSKDDWTAYVNVLAEALNPIILAAR